MLAAGVAALGLAACGSSPAPGGAGGHASLSGQTLTVYTQAPYGTQLKDYEQYYAYIGAAFHKATGSTIKWDYSTSTESLSQEIENAAATGTGPDVFSLGSSFDGTAYATKEFYTLTSSDWDAAGGQAAFVPTMLTEAGPNNANDIAVPFESIPFVMAYNKALFAKAGVTSAPSTWAQWIADGQAVQKSDPGVNGSSFSPSDPYGPWKPIWSYMEQLGGDFLSSSGTTATMNNPQLVAAIKFYFAQDFQYHIVPAADLTWQGAQEESAFAAGKTAMIADSTYSLYQELAGTPVQQDVAFAPMPSVPDGLASRPSGGHPAESIVSGNYYAVAKYESNLPLALKFIQVSTSAAAQLEQFNVMGWMPVTRAGIAEVEKAHPAVASFITAEENSTPTDFTPAWADIETGLLAVIAHVAQQLATGHPYSDSYVMSQLQAANAVAQQHLASS
jgi:multiple sugar transport system substrate-binding protein